MSILESLPETTLPTAAGHITTRELAQEVKHIADGRYASPNRRRFLATLGALSASASAFAAAGCGDANAPLSSTPAPVTGASLTDVLNFALNLEYFEASYYLYVTTGNGLPAADLGTSPGTVTGGAKVSFQNATVSSAAQQLAFDEQAHVELLRSTISTLGSTPVVIPAINLAAGGAVNSDATFLAAARRFETVGISAYAGSASLLVSNTTVLQTAGQILDTEAQHEGLLRQLCIALGVTSPAVDAQDIPPTASAVFNTNPTNGLNAIRSTSQVLQILYGTPGVTGTASGGFFPNGLNGNIKTS